MRAWNSGFCSTLSEAPMAGSLRLSSRHGRQQVGQPADAVRVVGSEDQPLGAYHKGDHLLTRPQPGLDTALAQAAEWPGRYVQASHLG
jgi:hypothetical protein